jgi:hypothetical protein
MDLFMKWILRDFYVENTHKTLFQQSHSNPQDFLYCSKTFSFPFTAVPNITPLLLATSQ